MGTIFHQNWRNCEYYIVCRHNPAQVLEKKKKKLFRRRFRYLGQSTKVWNRLLESMTEFWIFGKTHRLKSMVKNAASKNTRFTPNLAKNDPRKRVFPLYTEKKFPAGSTPTLLVTLEKLI